MSKADSGTKSINDDIKRMDLTEFRDFGFLQEVNRKFFHPLGLALEVIVDLEAKDDDIKVLRLGGVWDYRDDPEGMFFGISMIKRDKINYVEELRISKINARVNNAYNITTDENGVQLNELGEDI